jgi:hypothetical protein
MGLRVPSEELEPDFQGRKLAVLFRKKFLATPGTV